MRHIEVTPGQARILALVVAIFAALLFLFGSYIVIKSKITGVTYYKPSRFAIAERVTKQDSPKEYDTALKQNIAATSLSGLIAFTAFCICRKLDQ